MTANRMHTFILVTLFTLIAALSLAACGQTALPSEPKATVAPITISDDLTKIDLCQAIPKEDIEAVMGRKLVNAPRFEYYDTPGTSGCWYDAGKDASGEAHFGYVVLTPVDVYNSQPLYKNVNVSGIGDEAYFNNGAAARELWVKIDNKVAFVVAFGDVPNEAGAKAIARILVAAIK
jgi:hypothetical protein